MERSGRLQARLPDEVEGVREDGQGLEPEEVHLQQAKGLDLVLAVLGGHVLLAARASVEGAELGDGAGGDDDPRGVGGGVAREPLEALGHVQHLPHLRVAVVHGLEGCRLPERLLDGDPQVLGDVLGHLVHLVQGDAEGAAHVADGQARLHLSEGDDLRHVVAAVLVRHVVDDLAAAPHAEVDVDVGHGDALGVEEALEEEVVAEGVQVRDAHAVGHEGARRAAAPRAHGDVVLPGVAYEIPDHEEVAREVHLLDEAELELQALLVVLPPRAARPREEPLRRPPVEALPGHLHEVGVARLPLGHLEDGVVLAVGVEAEVAPLADGHGVLQRRGVVAEALPHLRGGLEVVLGAVGHLARLGPLLPRGLHLDAEEDVVGVEVLLPEEVDVVGGHEGDARLPVDVEDLAVHLLLLGQSLVLHLEEVVALAEDVLELQGRAERLLGLAAQELLGHLAAEAGGQGDEALVVLPQEVLVHARLVGEPLEEGRRAELAEVPVALLVLAQEHEVGVGPLALVARGPLVEARAVGHVGLAPDDGPQPRLRGLLVELHGPEEVPVVRDGHGRGAVGHRLLHQVVQAAGAVQQGVLGVQVQVDELPIGHGRPISDFGIRIWEIRPRDRMRRADHGRPFRIARNPKSQIPNPKCFLLPFYRSRRF